MISLPRALVIGATSRNCGKTTFICQLNHKFSDDLPVAIKIKTLYPDDESWHGSGRSLNEPFIIREELLDTGMKDSQRWLRSGAHKVYYIKSYHTNLENAIEALLLKVPQHLPLIIESNSIMDYIKPSAFFMISDGDRSKYKPSSKRLMHLATQIIKTDGDKHFPSPSELSVSWTQPEWLIN